MDRSKLIERLMATFLDELAEHVRAINDDLLALEKERGRTTRRGPSGSSRCSARRTA